MICNIGQVKYAQGYLIGQFYKGKEWILLDYIGLFENKNLFEDHILENHMIMNIGF